MDTRKLTYREGHEPHNQALIYDEETSVDVAVTYDDEGGATAAELVRRWNAYPELVDALNSVAGHWQAAEDEGNQAHALDLATCPECKNVVRALLRTLNP